MRFKGSFLDLFFVGAFIIAAAIIVYVAYFGVDTVATACENTATSIGAASYADDACTNTRVAFVNFISMIPFVVFAVGLGMLLAAAFLPISRIYLPLGILMLLIATGVFYNIQTQLPGLFSNSFFLPLVATFPLPALLAQNVGLIVLVFGAALLIVLFGLPRQGSGGTPEG